MSLDDTRELGKFIGTLSRQQQDTNQQISPDEVSDQDNIFAQFGTDMSTTVTVIRKDLATDSFVIDHPVYGDVDSAILSIDGGYLTGADSPTFPAVFPWMFVDGLEVTSLLYTETY